MASACMEDLGSVNNRMNRIISFLPHILLLLIILPASFLTEESIIKPSEFTNMEGTINLHYNKRTGLHQFYASGGVTGLETKSESTGIELVGFTTDKLSDLAFGNAYSNTRPTTGKIVTRLVSGYGNFAYSYDNRYQVEASMNADASSQFGENNRVASHWSAGASWNLHQERFFHENKILNQLRVRASVGTAGSQYFNLTSVTHIIIIIQTDNIYKVEVVLEQGALV